MGGRFGRIAAATAIAVTAAGGALAADEFNDAQKDEIGTIVRDYLLEHPEVLVEAMQELQEREEAAAQAKAQEVLTSRPNEIYNDGYSLIAGDPSAEVTVVEFFDYNCGYCRKAFEKMMALAAENSNVRFIFKEYPVLGADSELAAKAALAAANQGKYLEFHRTMMAHEERANTDTIEDAARKIGLNMAQFRKDLDDPVTAARIEANLKLGDDLQLTGTPSFIIGNEILGGWSATEVDRLIEEAKKKS